VGTPAKAVKERDNHRANRLNAWLYHRNAQAYKVGDHRAWEGEDFIRWRKEIKHAISTDEDLKVLEP
jgi:hypothetical protein